jgi:acyl-coenzyme A synthetase/AMP-(fatty) acid ligase
VSSNLTERVKIVFRESLNRPFLFDAGAQCCWTYSEAVSAAVFGVRWLSSHGAKRGDKIGFDLPNGYTFALFYLVCLLGGFVAVPLNAAIPPRDRGLLLSKAGVKYVVADSPSDETDSCPVLLVRGSGSPDSKLFGFEKSAGCPVDLGVLSSITPTDILSIHFTSGSTGKPKGVVHCVGSLLGNAQSFVDELNIGHDRRFFHVMPMGYMAGFLNTLLCPLMAGASIVIAPQFSAGSALTFWRTAREYDADVFWLSPTMLATLCRVDRGQEGVKHCSELSPLIFSATAPLTASVRASFEEKYRLIVIESYGLSELLLLSANTGALGSKACSVGPAFSKVSIEVRARGQSNVPSNVEGDIFVDTPFKCVGYVDYFTGEIKADNERWFDSGDLGYFDNDGYLYVTGRRKDIIIKGGFNISPRAIEEVLLGHPLVELASVVGVTHDFRGEEVVAVVVLKGCQNSSGAESEFRAQCLELLGALAVPDRFIFAQSLPMTVTGKVQKSVLKQSILKGVLE